MQRQKFFPILAYVFGVILLATVFASTASAQYKSLYQFTGPSDGQASYASLILDSAGNLYGTTTYGGDHSMGTAFKLTSHPDGSWTKSTIYSFKGFDPDGDGSYPYGNLVFDSAGNLYGTTQTGGIFYSGAVFKLAPNPDGSWTESILHTFAGYDGSQPVSGLIFDAAGSLYGTTTWGGAFGSGAVFKLAPNPDGSWTESVLHSFNIQDGQSPYAGVIFDAAGNLYGTTNAGGAHNVGAVFKLTPQPGGTWTEQVILSCGGRAEVPFGGLVFDGAGNLYGTAAYTENLQTGTVFRLSPNPDGTWTQSKLHAFTVRDGRYPYAGLTIDAAGNLYGTTLYGGANDAGVVFKLAEQPDGHWRLSRLHSFKNNYPRGGLVMDAAGNLYGTTPYGGAGESGVVFKVTPP